MLIKWANWNCFYLYCKKCKFILISTVIRRKWTLHFLKLKSQYKSRSKSGAVGFFFTTFSLTSSLYKKILETPWDALLKLNPKLSSKFSFYHLCRLNESKNRDCDYILSVNFVTFLILWKIGKFEEAKRYIDINRKLIEVLLEEDSSNNR